MISFYLISVKVLNLYLGSLHLRIKIFELDYPVRASSLIVPDDAC